MPVVHLICGFLGAGKSTFSVALAKRSATVRFSTDEPYLQLFAEGPTYELDSNKMARLLGVLNELWPRVASAGVDVVLDFGFWSRSLRDEVRRLAHSAGAQSRLYWLQCPDEVALGRCLGRNGAPGAFLISEQGFFELKQRFQAPGADEPFELVNSST